MKNNQGGEQDVWSRRPEFSPRQILTAEQLNDGFQDALLRQQIINRAIHGHGVVIGFGLSVQEEGALDLQDQCLQLGEGVALDRHGRMLVWKGGRLGIDDLAGEHPGGTGTYTLIAHYAVRTPNGDDCTPSEGSRSPWTEEGVVFTLNPSNGDNDWGCPEHPQDRPVGHREYLHRRNGGLPLGMPSVEPSPDVDWYSRKPGPTRDACHDGWEYDANPAVGVPLAQVEICNLVDPDQSAGGCDPRYGFNPESTPEVVTVRPLVYRNPVLYELAHCCDTDLPRVKDISWQEWIDKGWDEPVRWWEFEQWVTSETAGFAINFTKPVDPSTLHEGSVFVTAFYQDDDASWRSYRVPLSRLEQIKDEDKVIGVGLVPQQKDWIDAEISSPRTNLVDGARIEVTIRGQLVRDEFGRMLDARPVEVECNTRCQARPGDDYVSVFQVGPKDRSPSVPNSTGDRAVADHGQATEKPGA
jgi:hypothetical protein